MQELSHQTTSVEEMAGEIDDGRLPRRPYGYAAIVAALASFLFTACDSETGKQIRSLPACEHFGNVAQDVREGVLTAPELREKLKQIDDDARAAPDDVQAAATAMLSAITRGDAAALVAAGVQMDAACKAHHTAGAS